MEREQLERAIEAILFAAGERVDAHRLATVRTAKYALVLENGRITEDGTLADLVRTPNGYLNKLLYIE